jgi:hypothetical protein
LIINRCTAWVFGRTIAATSASAPMKEHSHPGDSPVMKHFPTIIAVAACAVLALAAPVAHADSFYGPLSVNVWVGSGITD